MTDVLLGQSYYLRFDPKLYEAMQPYPPLGTMIAASLLREEGYTVALFDAMLAASEQEWAEKLAATQPTYAIIYEDNFNYLSKMCMLRMRQAAFTMLEMANAQGCVTIVVGSDASDHPAGYLQAGADYVIQGEGEAALLDLLAHLEQAADASELASIVTMHEGEVKTNPRRPVMRDVDSLPFPAWDLIDVERYRSIWVERHGYYAMNMVTTRGCPYHCNWCAKPIWGQRYNARSPENVAEELAWLKRTYQLDYIWFADDIMGLKPGWWQRFANAVEEKNCRIPFKCLSRADLIVRDADNVAALARAGCDIVWLGAESGAQSVLNAMEKGTTVEQIHQAADMLHAAGVRVAFFLQFGYPGETRADIEATLQMVRDCQPDDIGISVSYPLPGTRFHENVKGQLGAKRNWVDSADLDMMYNGPFPTAFYRQLHSVVHKEFRSRRTLQRWQQIWNQPTQWQRRDLREAAATAYRLATLPLARYKLNKLADLPHEASPSLPHMSFEQAAQPTAQDG